MSINDIADAIEYQDVWSSWQSAGRDNVESKREHKRKMDDLKKGLQ